MKITIKQLAELIKQESDKIDTYNLSEQDKKLMKLPLELILVKAKELAK